MNLIAELNEINSITPVIVCGAARSGTRMITDILNAHPEIAIQHEMHSGTIEAYFDMVDIVTKTFDHHSERKGKYLAGVWDRSRKGLTHSFFASACKKGPVGAEKKSLRFHGIKTPGFERYFDQFENAFQGISPKYIYCVRSVEKVWPSWVALGYLTDVEIFHRRYLRSLRQANRILKKAPERLAVFDLDAFVESENKAQYLQDRVFSPIGVEDSHKYSNDFLSLPNRNSLERTGRAPVSSDKLMSEVQMLKSCDLIKEQRLRLGLSA